MGGEGLFLEPAEELEELGLGALEGQFPARVGAAQTVVLPALALFGAPARGGQLIALAGLEPVKAKGGGAFR